MKPQYKKFLKRLDRMRTRKEMEKAIKENEMLMMEVFEPSEAIKRAQKEFYERSLSGESGMIFL